MPVKPKKLMRRREEIDASPITLQNLLKANASLRRERQSPLQSLRQCGGKIFRKDEGEYIDFEEIP